MNYNTIISSHYQTYILKNHHYTDENIVIKATIEFKNSQLKLNYEIVGQLSKYNFPKKTKQQRADNLWLDTCFELFIADINKKEYWEINISPSTEWNSYHFTKYKKNMKKSYLFSTPCIKIKSNENKYKFSFDSTMQKKILKKELQINICVIILDKNKKRNFYSINRRNSSPDFHDRLQWNSF